MEPTVSTRGTSQRVVHVDVYRDPAAVAQACAEDVAAAAEGAIAEHGRFLWCLAGGETPKATYALLAKEPFVGRIDWRRVHVFFGDERAVPPDHEASNYGMLQQALLRAVALPAQQVHRIAGEHEPGRAAAEYERMLRQMLGASECGRPAAGFDLLLLGMGSDGHTASLFPRSKDETDAWVSARQHPSDGSWRVTLTPRVLNVAHETGFIVTGSSKAARLFEVLTGPERPTALPAQRVRPTGALRWTLDGAAARRLLEDGEQPGGKLRLEIVVHRDTLGAGPPETAPVGT